MFRTYLKWFTFRRRGNYRNTRLIGNPGEVRGYANDGNRQSPAFQRAEFGKYEQRRRRKRKWRWLALPVLFVVGAWILYESIQGMGVFQ